MIPSDLDKTFADAPDNCQAFIVGPNHFQNTLFATYIETHSQWKSSIVDSIALIASNSGKISSIKTAILYDCFGLSSTALDASVLAEIEQLSPEWSLVLFNLDRQAGIEKKALEQGVHGFFYRDDSIETLLKGLTVVFGGEFWISRRQMADIILENAFRLRHKQISNDDYPHNLTRREVELLGLLTLGASNEDIANKLFISPHTVRTHFNHIFRKIKVTSRLEASIWATEILFQHKYD